MLRSKFSWYLHHNYSQFSTCQSSISFRQSSSFSCDMLWSLFRLSSPSSCFLSWTLWRDSTRGATVDHPCCQVELGPDPALSSAKRPGHKKNSKEATRTRTTCCNILQHIATYCKTITKTPGSRRICYTWYREARWRYPSKRARVGQRSSRIKQISRWEAAPVAPWKVLVC